MQTSMSTSRRAVAKAAAGEKGLRARRADSRDAEVGMRVRTRRLEMKLSQTELANLVGVTFQQVQKYEKGANRIGAGRLQRISEALTVPVSYFFGNGSITQVPNSARDTQGGSVFALMQSRGSVRVVQALARIKNQRIKRLYTDLVEAIADAESDA
jgi:transcriptional regulator with XRE-family HTH domain